MKENPYTPKLTDGKALLNVGCGTRMHWAWNNLDFSPYAFLAHHKTLARLLKKIGILSVERSERLAAVDPEIILRDMQRGLPFKDDCFDAVYHSHVLEHFDKDSAGIFLKECQRILKPGGIIRVVVPDLQVIISRYASSLTRLEKGDAAALTDHQETVDALFEQMVRRTPAGTAKQHPFVRFLESCFRGDAAKAGELHRWMYDSYTLQALLNSVGFQNIRTHTPLTSRIEGWHKFHLDTNEDASVYKPGSLYMEGVK